MAMPDFKNPAVQKGILFSLAGIGLLAVFFATHFLPFGFQNQREKIATLRTEYDQKATELQRARATVADLPRFEAEYALLHEQWAKAAELLPVERQLPALMRKITLSAQQNGVGFMSFRPGGAKQEQYYTETPIQLSVYGNYHQVGAFLADLANMRRIVTVSGVSIKTNTRVKSVAATTTAEFTASAYHLNSTSTAPAAVVPDQPKAKKEEESNGKAS